MAYQLTILPIMTYPYKDELFSSWLFRLASSNISKAHTFTRFHLPGYNIWNRDIDRLAQDSMIERLSTLTEIPFEKIFNLTLRSYETNLFEVANKQTKQKWVLALGVYHRTWKNNGLQFCPSCLSNDNQPYFRKAWRLATSVVCTRCQLLLHDCCPNCNTPVTFFRTDIGFKIDIAPMAIVICPNCDFDLRNSPCYPPMIGTLGFQHKINRTLKVNAWHGKPAFEYFNVLYQVLKILRSNSKCYKDFKGIIMNSEGMRISDLPVGKELETMSTIEREHLIRIGSWILEEWPARFIELCKEAKLGTSAVVRDSTTLPSWFKDEAQGHLHQPTAIELNFLRSRKA